jgi:hypothetical protein
MHGPWSMVMLVALRMRVPVLVMLGRRGADETPTPEEEFRKIAEADRARTAHGG